MKKIKLGKTNKETLISDGDYSNVVKYKWSMCRAGKGYARAWIDGKDVYLHHFLVGKIKNKEIDHVNGNTLDNRRKNLRFCNRSQNQMNRSKSANKSSIYKGVDLNKFCNKWRARVRKNGRYVYEERFNSEVDAARAYNNAALIFYGKYANLNKII
jgi:hypothetical protein